MSNSTTPWKINGWFTYSHHPWKGRKMIGTKLPTSMIMFYVTLPQTNIDPKKWWFPIRISFSRGCFSGAMLVSGRVIFKGVPPETQCQNTDTSNFVFLNILMFRWGFYGTVADVTRQLRSTAFAQQETFANVQVDIGHPVLQSDLIWTPFQG